MWDAVVVQAGGLGLLLKWGADGPKAHASLRFAARHVLNVDAATAPARTALLKRVDNAAGLKRHDTLRLDISSTGRAGRPLLQDFKAANGVPSSRHPHLLLLPFDVVHPILQGFCSASMDSVDAAHGRLADWHQAVQQLLQQHQTPACLGGYGRLKGFGNGGWG